MSSGDECSAVGYLAPQYLEPHRDLARQFSVNDSGIVDLHGSRTSSRIGLAIPNNCYGDWDQESDPRTPTSTHPFLQRTNSHPPLSYPWSNHLPVVVQAPDKYTKVPDYEELPNSNRNPDDLGVYTPIDEGSVIVATTKRYATTPNGKQSQISITSPKENSRLRTNPLYDQSGGPLTLPRYPPPKKGLCVGGPCCLQTFGFLFALAAFAVVLVNVLAGYSGEPKYAELTKDLEDLRSNFSKLYQMVQNNRQRNDSSFLSRISDFNPIVQLLHNNSEMLQTLSDLETKVMSLRMQVSLQEASIQNLTNQMATLTDQITFVKSQENHANETFENLKQSLGKIKQLGMRGFNVSACSHSRKSYGVSSAFDENKTDNLDLSDVLVLGVLCTTNGGTEALLEDTPSTPNIYRCICRGRRATVDSRSCIIHYWTCPLLP